MSRAQNLIFFQSDNHARDALGCYGNPVVQTPVLDRIARSGARFANAYTTCPICCPARAGIATGRYVHQNGCWDNAIVYDGRIPSWMHRLRDAGQEVVSVGKLHFRSAEDDNGFSEEILPMHIFEGRGGVTMLLRWNGQEPQALGQWDLYMAKSGVGESHYQDYDRDITQRAIAWLGDPARRSDRPWTLFVSYVSPHPPFMVPQRLLDLYDPQRIALPPAFRPGERPDHPAIRHLRAVMDFRDMTDEGALRRVAAAYYALITHVDEQIGQVMKAAEELGLLDSTRVLYTSDHGELYGAHGLFGKACLYEGSAGVPLLISGAGVPEGRVVNQLVSHVDLFPTILEGAGLSPHAADRDLPGVSLFPAMHGAETARPVFAEYHAAGSSSGSFMLREGDLKLVYHVGLPAQLFDLAKDPQELRDLVADGTGLQIAARLEGSLRKICDPEEVDARARHDQKAKAAFWGGREAILKAANFAYTPPPAA